MLTVLDIDNLKVDSGYWQLTTGFWIL